MNPDTMEAIRETRLTSQDESGEFGPPIGEP